jgi:Alpha-amylase C-terminal beta-sheet domain
MIVQESEVFTQDIMFLINLRKEAGIKVSSKINILTAVRDSYVADITGDRLVIRCKLGPQQSMGRWNALESDGWEQVLVTKNACLWTRSVTIDAVNGGTALNGVESESAAYV